ncbi:MAG: GGDEF domain-containing protein [Actinomycetota bacterium]
MWARSSGEGGAGRLAVLVVAAVVVLLAVGRWAIEAAASGGSGAVVAVLTALLVPLVLGGMTIAVLRHRERAAVDALRSTREDLALLDDHAGVGIVDVDERGRVERANGVAARFLASDGSAVVGRELTSFASETSVGDLLYALFRTATQGRTTKVGIDLRIDDRVVATDVTVVDRSRRGGALTVLLRDVSERAAMLRELERLIHHDELTGLPNRRSFRRSLSGLVQRGSKAAVLFIDINGFKTVNDSHGDVAGDEVLVEVAHRLLRELRDSDIVARLGADEFGALLYRCDLAQAQAAADRIVDAVSSPIATGDIDVELSASVGISLVDGAEMSADAVLQSADTAMYRAKAAHKASIRAGLTPCRPVDVELADSITR